MKKTSWDVSGIHLGTPRGAKIGHAIGNWVTSVEFVTYVQLKANQDNYSATLNTSHTTQHNRGNSLIIERNNCLGKVVGQVGGGGDVITGI